MGTFQLGYIMLQGELCAKDADRAQLLFRQSAELGYPMAANWYAQMAFGHGDWRDITGGDARLTEGTSAAFATPFSGFCHRLKRARKVASCSRLCL
jgi:TPR repeat protein